jgi:hypothetical protein
MFYIDLWGFFIDPLYFSNKSAGQEIHVLCILTFQGPFQTQIDLEFLALIFYHENLLEHKKSMRRPRGPKEH